MINKFNIIFDDLEKFLSNKNLCLDKTIFSIKKKYGNLSEGSFESRYRHWLSTKIITGKYIDPFNINKSGNGG